MKIDKAVDVVIAGTPYMRSLQLVFLVISLLCAGCNKSKSIDELVSDLKSSDPRARMTATKALATAGAPAVTPLIDVLKDNDPIVRKGAAWSLKIIGSASVDPLISALTSDDANTRENAALTLGEIKDARAVEPLISALKDKSATVRVAILKALGSMNDPRAVEPVMERMTGDKDQNVRWTAEYAAEKLKRSLKDEKP